MKNNVKYFKHENCESNSSEAFVFALEEYPGKKNVDNNTTQSEPDTLMPSPFLIDIKVMQHRYREKKMFMLKKISRTIQFCQACKNFLHGSEFPKLAGKVLSHCHDELKNKFHWKNLREKLVEKVKVDVDLPTIACLNDHGDLLNSFLTYINWAVNFMDVRRVQSTTESRKK